MTTTHPLLDADNVHNFGLSLRVLLGRHNLSLRADRATGTISVVPGAVEGSTIRYGREHTQVYNLRAQCQNWALEVQESLVKDTPEHAAYWAGRKGTPAVAYYHEDDSVTFGYTGDNKDATEVFIPCESDWSNFHSPVTTVERYLEASRVIMVDHAGKGAWIEERLGVYYWAGRRARNDGCPSLASITSHEEEYSPAVLSKKAAPDLSKLPYPAGDAHNPLGIGLEEK